MAKADIWMKLYIGDYLADTSHLTTEQHGAYLLLLMHYYRSGPLPNDRAQLRSITKCSPIRWKKIAPIVMSFFYLDGDNKFRNKRSDEEMVIATELKQSRHDKAVSAAHSRWEKLMLGA
jgi:uncharacterized protein YdaU (DUF1376 family)